MESKNARLGLQLYGIYLLLYGGFVLINTFAADLMEKTPFAGINLAIIYGFGLIVGALVLALIYGFLCRENGTDKGPTASAGDSDSASAEDA